jgi:hypothetical protein
MEIDPPRGRPDNAGEQVEERGLACTIRTNDAVKPSGQDTDGQIRNGQDTSEALGDSLSPYKRR